MARLSAAGFRSRAQQQIPSLHHQHESYRWWVLANIMIGTFMAVLDATIVNVALPKIMASFGVTVDKVEWVVTAYMLVMAVMLPTSGWVADHIGFKRTYFFALFLFTFGSFLCGLSWDENALVVFRIIQGARSLGNSASNRRRATSACGIGSNNPWPFRNRYTVVGQTLAQGSISLRSRSSRIKPEMVALGCSFLRLISNWATSSSKARLRPMSARPWG